MHDYRFDVGQISVVFCVVIGGNDYTDGQFSIFANLILLLVVLNLLVADRTNLI